MKKYNILLALFILSSCVSCNSNSNNQSEDKNDKMVNQEIADTPFIQEASEDGKVRIVDKNDNPILVLSALLRTDLLINADFLSPNQMEDYFAICKETGLNCIDIPIMWSQIEKQADNYVFDDLKTYLDYAKKYNLKVNIEWYGSFVDGETHSANIPEYVCKDKKNYPMIQDMFDFANYGRCYIIDWSNPKLLERESKALYSMMNYIHDWNHENSLYDPVLLDGTEIRVVISLLNNTPSTEV